MSRIFLTKIEMFQVFFFYTMTELESTIIRVFVGNFKTTSLMEKVHIIGLK